MPAPKEILDLVARFELHVESYKTGGYNETQLRRDYLDPFFKALGWDIDNTSGHAETYRDVIHEDAIRIGGTLKAPDYCFRVGGTRKFFLEAKKPKVVIKDDIIPAYQLRRYAWTAKLPLSILSDFEEFAIYDCRVRPAKSDKASAARIFYCTFRELPEKWDYIASIFSKDAVLRGSFDKYAAENKAKRGTAEVDAAFLEEIERWRKELAQNLALRNAALTQRELNFAVQRIIDRIIFLRIAEDRGLEEYGRLAKLTELPAIYSQLCKLFEAADARYNSGLFHFKKEKDRHEDPDELTLDLDLDDKLLKDILKNLYYPDSPYEFSILSADILGQVYEQFLGKVITLTDGHRAKVDDKPEVKKAGGVYYTPTYIVDYIVRETVGKLLDDCSSRREPALTPPAGTDKESGLTSAATKPDHRRATAILDRVAKLRVLDPACGSGSFLIGAYQFLLDWHLQFYLRNDPARWAKEITRAKKKGGVALSKARHPVLVQTKSGAWQLSIAERKRILLDNIYGVDLDSQAVEVTKLSLLLKVLEGEAGLAQMTLGLSDRVLPDLGDNIKCGNSLIDPDFYAQTDLPALTDEERYRINVFDWRKEFPEIFEAGGFDAVIGNPPYIFAREQISDVEKEYFSTHYKLSWEKQNTFLLFMEALLHLLNKSGLGGYIVPNSWLTIESGRLLRERYVKRIGLLADLNYPAFEKVSMEPCIFISHGQDITSDVQVARAKTKDEFLLSKMSPLKRSAWTGNEFRMLVPGSGGLNDLLEKVGKKSVPIGSKFDVRTGLQAYEKGKGKPPQTERDVRDHVFDRTEREDVNSVRYLEGRDVGRFELSWSGMWMQYGPWLSQPREIEMFSRPRVLLREITAPPPYCLYATFTSETFLSNKSILTVLHREDDSNELKALACVLNSRLLSTFYKNRAVKGARTIFPKVVIKNLREFPYPKDLTAKHVSKLAAHADGTLLLHRQRAAARTPQEQSALDRQIQSTDAQIDRLVYELYGLTADEIRLVEGTATPAAEASPSGAAPALPPGQSTAQSEGDSAHYYSFKEEPPTYG